MSRPPSVITQLVAARELIDCAIRDMARAEPAQPREESVFEKLARRKQEDEDGEFGMEPPTRAASSSTAPAETPASAAEPTDDEE